MRGCGEDIRPSSSNVIPLLLPLLGELQELQMLPIVLEPRDSHSFLIELHTTQYSGASCSLSSSLSVHSLVSNSQFKKWSKSQTRNSQALNGQVQALTWLPCIAADHRYIHASSQLRGAQQPPSDSLTGALHRHRRRHRFSSSLPYRFHRRDQGARSREHQAVATGDRLRWHSLCTLTPMLMMTAAPVE